MAVFEEKPAVGNFKDKFCRRIQGVGFIIGKVKTVFKRVTIIGSKLTDSGNGKTQNS